MEEVVELTDNIETLKTDIRDITTTTRTMEKNAETEVLSNLKGVQTRMKTCQTQLETLIEWDQLCSSCEDAVSSEDTEVVVDGLSEFQIAASLIEDMAKSVVLLSDLPGQEKRLQSLQSFRQRLEDQLSPKLQTALSTKNEPQQLLLHKIYCHLDIESRFIDAFCSHYTSTFIESVSLCSIISSIWKSAQAESPTDSLQNFYSALHTWLISLSEEILSLFGDRDDGKQDEDLLSRCNDSTIGEGMCCSLQGSHDCITQDSCQWFPPCRGECIQLYGDSCIRNYKRNSEAYLPSDSDE